MAPYFVHFPHRVFQHPIYGSTFPQIGWWAGIIRRIVIGAGRVEIHGILLAQPLITLTSSESIEEVRSCRIRKTNAHVVPASTTRIAAARPGNNCRKMGGSLILLPRLRSSTTSKYMESWQEIIMKKAGATKSAKNTGLRRRKRSSARCTK